MAKFGIVELFNSAYLRFTKATNSIDIAAPASITNSYQITLPAAPPGSTQAVTMDTTGAIAFQALGGGGSVTSVGLSLPSIFNVTGSPLTSSGTIAASLMSQSANTFLASPSGTAGTPTFRAIAWADVSGLAGISGTSFAAGNDSRLHSQNTDNGTTAASFQIDSGNAGFKLKNTGGIAEFRNAADSAFADVRVKNLFVTGTTTTINSEQVSIDDNIITLNSNVTSGTPTEDLGIEGLRGSQASASLKWIESTARWAAGLLGAEAPITRVFEVQFTNASLTAGILTVNHNLGRRVLAVAIADDTFKGIGYPDQITYVSANQLTIDLTSFGAITGTWTLEAIG